MYPAALLLPFGHHQGSMRSQRPLWNGLRWICRGIVSPVQCDGRRVASHRYTRDAIKDDIAGGLYVIEFGVYFWRYFL